MKTVLIILVLLMVFGGFATYLSIKKKLKQNVKQARSKVEKIQSLEKKKLEKLRQENE